MKTLTIKETESIKWHLRANVFPVLTEKTIDGIVNTVNEVRTNKKKLTDTIHKNTDCTCGEMIEDLKLTDYIH